MDQVLNQPFTENASTSLFPSQLDAVHVFSEQNVPVLGFQYKYSVYVAYKTMLHFYRCQPQALKEPPQKAI